MANYSFESSHATNQGEALDWTVSDACQAEGIGKFDDKTTTWLPWETFGGEWRIPFVVHTEADTANTIAIANAADLATARTLANAITAAYTNHALLAGNIHLVEDLTNAISADDAWDLSALTILVNNQKAVYNAHAIFAVSHGKKDAATLVTTADASDLGTSIALVNDIKAKFNDHLDNIGSGAYAIGALFGFTDALISAGTFSDGGLSYENFERSWSIPEVLRDEAGNISPEEQQKQVSTYLTSTSWPTGHVQFLRYFEHIATEIGTTQTYEADWKLPGNLDYATNDRYLARYYAPTGDWAFSDQQLRLGVSDAYEADWGNNDTFKTKYWDAGESEWRFTAGHLDTTGNITETFETSWTLTLD